VKGVAGQLQRLSAELATFYEDVHGLSKENEGLFPVEVDLSFHVGRVVGNSAS
jgi:hypothetical protein